MHNKNGSSYCDENLNFIVIDTFVKELKRYCHKSSLNVAMVKILLFQFKGLI